MSRERGAESSCSRRRVTDTGGANGSVLVWSLLFTVITSGMVWFQKQPNQPVTAFACRSFRPGWTR